MKLTICLVSRGRTSFLEQCLSSLRLCKESGLAEVLVFDNGSPSEASAFIAQWCVQNQVERVRFEQNDSGPTSVWNEIKSRNLEWVVFPGDDDIFLPDSLGIFWQEVNRFQFLAAVAFNLSTIDEFGRDLHAIRKPQFSGVEPRHVSIAQSFNEPQFLWPSLFFRADLMADLVVREAPTSRFYFDWWVGQQLLLLGNVVTVNQASLKYRVHAQQESSLADSRRKFFEATFWSLQMIQSENFVEWLRSLSEPEVLEFWMTLSSKKPIYSNDFFGNQLLMKISQLILEHHKSMVVVECIVGGLAANNGVYLKNGETKNFTQINQMRSLDMPASNLHFLIAPGSCDRLIRGASFFSNSRAGIKVLSISCKHSEAKRVDIEYDCDEFARLESDQIADLLVMKAVLLAEEQGEYEFLVTQRERVLILKLRSLKDVIPGQFFQAFKMIFERLEKQK